MGAPERLAADVDFAGSEAFAAMCRTQERFFTRERALTCASLFSLMCCRAGLGSELEAAGLAADGVIPAVSRQAVAKAREKADPEALASMARRHAAAVYGQEGPLTVLGLVPVAIDGTTAELPTCARTLAEWGSATGRAGGAQRACLGLSCAHDPLRRQILSIDACGPFFDERSHVLGHLERAAEVCGTRSLLALLDRGYPSFALLADLQGAGFRFLARCESTFMEREFAECAGAGGDLEVEVRLTRSRLSHLPAEDRDRLAGRTLRLRLALVDIGGEAPERLVTDLPADAAPPEALKGAYHMRWGVETCFGELKGRLRLEDWSGTTRAQILQDVYAAAYVLNVLEDLAADADRLARARAGDPEAPVAASRSYATGVLKRGLRGIARDPLHAAARAYRMVAEMSRHTVAVRPGRSFARKGLLHGGKRRAACAHKRSY